MAILNNILKGQLKGRIGNTWFAHAKSQNGRPVTRAGSINESPNNPKTYKQMEQRARFANSVKFYQRATQNFFKFAYEDKKANESDYNAFMRHNIERSLVLPKDRVDAVMFPALGTRWMMSQGSLDVYLPSSLLATGSNHTSYESGIFGVDVASASKHLIDFQGAAIGDIVTLVVIVSQVSRDNATSLDDVESAPIWNVIQFLVDPSSKLDWDDLKFIGNTDFTLAPGDDEHQMSVDIFKENVSVWATTIVTRKTNNRLRATTSYLLDNVQAQQLAALYHGADKISSAATSWGAVNSAILKGGIATRTVGSDSDDDVSATRIAYVNDQNPPASINLDKEGTRTMQVSGSNLPNTSPTSSDTSLMTIQDFELNDAKTVATFQIVGMKKEGTASVRYAGMTIANVQLISTGAGDADA